MIFVHIWWTLLLLCGLGFALNTKEAKLQPRKQRNQQEESSRKQRDEDNTLIKWPARPEDPEDNYELYKMELSDRFHKVLSGRLPKEIMDIVFELIHNDTEFEQILSKLERNLKARKEKLMLQAEEEGDYCEIMTKLKCCRNSNPIVPPLQEFYDLVLKTADEEKKIRENRKNSLWILAENSTKNISHYRE